MNDDYLWNKTGEPDPDVQELEDILGVLRYTPRPFVLPTNLVQPVRRRFTPYLAIAAAVVLALLAASIWVAVRFSKTPASQQAQQTQKPAPEPEKKVLAGSEREAIANNNSSRGEPSGINQSGDKAPHSKRVAARHSNNNAAAVARRESEREEALEAKQQLLMALRVASEKLSQAQKKTQTPVSPNQLRNQHKVS